MEKIYTMYNKETNARIQCTENFLDNWLKRGFEIESERFGEFKKEVMKEEE
ncbi:hypothetical protein M3664_04520 [Paenibacillus lautus]|uniref:hypothetical protein n=1 Tax=Paenibacillus lautus TaxID=1401 RepID=UPI00203B8BD3|nr:hypothetical protein [Paenibacillus lautus]MCM3257045.1 hypothetical protein [Paenibacillus lautus]